MSASEFVRMMRQYEAAKLGGGHAPHGTLEGEVASGKVGLTTVLEKDRAAAHLAPEATSCRTCVRVARLTRQSYSAANSTSTRRSIIPVCPSLPLAPS